MKQYLPVILILFLFSVNLTQSETTSPIPQLINYQGMLTNAEGQPLETKEYKLSFSIFTQAIGGIAVWGPQVFNSVSVIQGQFNIILGPLDEKKRSIINAFNTDNCYLYLGVKVGDINLNLNDVAEISPRQKILSVPYAFNAKTARTIKGNNIFEDQQKDYLGIGTTHPQSKLHVNGEILISQTGIDCNSNTEGAIRYDSNN